MVIKSGEGVVYLTRPQKYFSSSLPSTKNKFIVPIKNSNLQRHLQHPDTMPRPTKIDAKALNIASFRGEKNLTSLAKAGIIIV